MTNKLHSSHYTTGNTYIAVYVLYFTDSISETSGDCQSELFDVPRAQQQYLVTIIKTRSDRRNRSLQACRFKSATASTCTGLRGRWPGRSRSPACCRATAALCSRRLRSPRCRDCSAALRRTPCRRRRRPPRSRIPRVLERGSRLPGGRPVPGTYPRLPVGRPAASKRATRPANTRSRPRTGRPTPRERSRRSALRPLP